MTETTIHRLPPLLAAAITYAADQPHLGTLEAALDTARVSLHLDDRAARERARMDFIRREGHDGPEMEDMTDDQHTAAIVSYGEAGYLLGFATCWLLLHEKGGTR